MRLSGRCCFWEAMQSCLCVHLYGTTGLQQACLICSLCHMGATR